MLLDDSRKSEDEIDVDAARSTALCQAVGRP